MNKKLRLTKSEILNHAAAYFKRYLCLRERSTGRFDFFEEVKKGQESHREFQYIGKKSCYVSVTLGDIEHEEEDFCLRFSVVENLDLCIFAEVIGASIVDYGLAPVCKKISDKISCQYKEKLKSYREKYYFKGELVTCIKCFQSDYPGSMFTISCIDINEPSCVKLIKEEDPIEIDNTGHNNAYVCCPCYREIMDVENEEKF